jgi:hypothetical protein
MVLQVPLKDYYDIEVPRLEAGIYIYICVFVCVSIHMLCIDINIYIQINTYKCVFVCVCLCVLSKYYGGIPAGIAVYLQEWQ